MATWVKDPEGSYVQIATIRRVYVSNDPEYNADQWFILGDTGGQVFVLKQGFASRVAAQTALDNAIVQLGGSV